VEAGDSTRAGEGDWKEFSGAAGDDSRGIWVEEAADSMGFSEVEEVDWEEFWGEEEEALLEAACSPVEEEGDCLVVADGPMKRFLQEAAVADDRVGDLWAAGQAASRNCFLVPDAEEEAEEEHHRLESPLAPEASPQLEA